MDTTAAANYNPCCCVDFSANILIIALLLTYYEHMLLIAHPFVHVLLIILGSRLLTAACTTCSDVECFC
ncbi:unnamed protein product [Amaranthus hypochondriacus]